MELGLSRAEFWRLTPREFRAFTDRLDEREQRADHRFGVLAALAANMMRDGEKQPRPYEPADFFGGLARRRATDEEVAAAWEAWARGAAVS